MMDYLFIWQNNLNKQQQFFYSKKCVLDIFMTNITLSIQNKNNNSWCMLLWLQLLLLYSVSKKRVNFETV